jgi:NodT family efflux transporter outer membrane factor (OMF) lipoprotein
MKSRIPGAGLKGAFLRGAGVLALSATLAACTTNPTPLDRPGDVPASFEQPAPNPQAPLWPSSDWWTTFQADELTQLEQTAQKENLDIAQAAARVIQAEAQDTVAFSALLPTLDANGGYLRKGAGHPHGPAFNTWSAGLSASYQQSFFGGEYFNLQSARQSLRASRYNAAVVGLSIEAQVADQYFTVLALRERIAITRANVDAAKRILSITQAKVSSGVSSNLDLAEQQAVLAGQEARLPGLIEQEKEARYGLAILMGRAPERYDVKGQNLDSITSPTVKPGLPSELLLRRPDVAQAEAQLYAAHANVDAARAAFFPSLGLTGDAGYSAGAQAGLINPANMAFSIGASIFQSIFDGGRVKAQSDSAKAFETELIAAYRKAVFSAFADVETSLGQVQSTSEQLTLIQDQVKASAEAFRISELQYREGTIDILSLLNSQQTLFTAQDSLVQTKLARLEANIGLYSALGGGWKQDESDANYKYQLDWWPL